MSNVKGLAEDVVRKLHYDPDTGILKNRLGRINALPGAILGRRDRDGYLRCRFQGKSYLVHRLIWLYVMGRWPSFEIDHINGIRDDNQWMKLREATRGQNCSNRRAGRKLPKGVYSEGERYRAMITFERKVYRIGVFATPGEAHDAYLRKALELRGEFARSE